jgi:amino-acid N-acetyltransferase
MLQWSWKKKEKRESDEGFFARRGYHKVGRDAVPAAIKETVEFQSLCPASAVCMVKHLGAAQ